MNRIERRQAPRIAVALSVKLEHGEGRTRDISASSVFFTTQEVLASGTNVKFTIEFEHADPSGLLPITCEGQVIRVEPSPDGIGVAVCINSYDFSGRRRPSGAP